MRYSVSWSWPLMVVSLLWLGCENAPKEKQRAQVDRSEASTDQESPQKADWQARRAGAPTGPVSIAGKFELPAEVIGDDLGELLMSPDGSFLYVTKPEAGEILTVRRDTETGELSTREDSTVSTKLPSVNGAYLSLDGARLVIPFEYAGYPPEGRHVYERDTSTSVRKYDPS